jgi:UPF0755 protein
VKRVLALFLAVALAACSGHANKSVTVIVAQGSSLKAAARMLEDQGAISSASGFLRHAKLFGSSDPIKPGEYEVQHLVMIPQGMPSIMVQEKLMAEPLLTGDVPVPAEGSILPDSYSFQKGEDRAKVVARMQAAMAKTLAKLWAERKPTSVAKTPQEAIILASIVEKETGKESERRTVAGVYSNRVRIGMKLQADPTIIYPVTKGKPLGRRILKSEVNANNGYNTYAMTGLPMGPIANPGKDAIAAVLDPAPTRALFFVADGTGGHVFAETGAQHQANVEKWYALRKARGEM